MNMSQDILRKTDSKENNLDEGGETLTEKDDEPTARSEQGPEDQDNKVIPKWWFNHFVHFNN